MRPELEGLIVPSNVYGIAAAGRPIIAFTPWNGDIARLVETCGGVIEPGNSLVGPFKKRTIAEKTHTVSP